MDTRSANHPFPLRRLLLDASRPFSDPAAWNRVIQRINPLWSTSEIRARVVRRVEESEDTFSLWLQTNRHWQGHQAGQHVALGVEIEGIMRRRVFSISNSANRPGKGARLLRVTIQRQDGNGVTRWLHANAEVGLVLDLSAAGGEFVLTNPPPRLLMIAGGSGITPLMAILEHLARDRFDGDIVLLQLCRNADRRLFGSELDSLAERLPGLSIQVHASAADGRLDVRRIPELVPDLADRHTLLCGPASLISDVGKAWEALAPAGQLQFERFAAPRAPARPGAEQAVHALRSEHTFTQGSGLSLLEAAEAAGLTPPHGCRAGLCRTCLCKKQSGTARNLLTGLSSSQPDEWIQLCVSVAETELELAL
ncbi:ferredoxin reductase [Wenzhouxiangella sp. EGI_FJ10409]|uniref:ferredoxin reductase n=1 Tax=Wenzhouxiangella sp. EGI_FJ10409 TaxID=3243767 RepID=UPI0035D52EA3